MLHRGGAGASQTPGWTQDPHSVPGCRPPWWRPRQVQSEVLPSVFNGPAVACLCLLTQRARGGLLSTLLECRVQRWQGFCSGRCDAHRLLGLALHEFQAVRGGRDSAPSTGQAPRKVLHICHATNDFRQAMASLGLFPQLLSEVSCLIPE